MIAAAACWIQVPAASAQAPWRGEQQGDPGRTARVAPTASTSSRAGLRRSLSRTMDGAGTSSGAYVYDLSDKRYLYGRRSKVARILASNTKLFTTGMAIERLGPLARRTTTVVADGPVYALDAAGTVPADAQPVTSLQPGGRYEVRGDLVLRGDGDPTMARSDLSTLARRIDAAGIARVRGKVRYDDSLLDRRLGTATSGYRLSSDVGALSALAYASARMSPSPAAAAATDLRTELTSDGVSVRSGTERGVPVSPAPLTLAGVDSPAISTIVRRTNRPSDNFYAEMLLRVAAAQLTGKRGTTKRGAALSASFADAAGAGGASLVDGSGLSRSDRATPKEVVALLRHMSAGEQADRFRISLPMAGSQGTLARRMRGTAAAGECRAKTGTLNGVSALSGYCDARNGHRIAFSTLMNDADVYSARAVQDRMAASIAGWRG